jgi:hypothetical protein
MALSLRTRRGKSGADAPDAIRAEGEGKETMTKKPGWEERSADYEVSFINQPIVDFVVEPVVVVKETARERADRIWGMKGEEGANQC